MKVLYKWEGQKLEDLKKAKFMENIENDVYEVSFVEYDSDFVWLEVSYSPNGAYSPGFFQLQVGKDFAQRFIEDWKGGVTQ